MVSANLLVRSSSIEFSFFLSKLCDFSLFLFGLMTLDRIFSIIVKGNTEKRHCYLIPNITYREFSLGH